MKNGLSVLPIMASLVLGCAAHRPALSAKTHTCRDAASTSYSQAAISDIHGDPEAAASAYLEVLRRCATSCEDPSVAVASAMALVAIRFRVVDVEGRLDALRAELGDRVFNLPPEARFQMGNLIAGRHMRRGHIDEAKREYLAMGCLLHWSGVGPFGPKPFAAWDALPRTLSTNPWPASFELGPGRGSASARDISENTCTVLLKDEAHNRPGAHVARTTVAAQRATEVLIRAQSSSSLRLRVGQATVLEKDTRQAAQPSTRWVRVQLQPGTTEIAVEAISGSGTSASFSLALLPTQARAFFERGDPVALANAKAKVLPMPIAPQAAPCLSSLHSHLTAALFNDDYGQAHALAESLAKMGGQERVLGMLGAAEALEADPDLPGESGFEAARDVYSQALDLDPSLHRATKRLASRAMDESRTQDALKLLRLGLERAPKEPELHLHLLDILAQKGWRAELVEEVSKLEKLLPKACSTLSWQHFAAQQVEQHQRALELAQAMTACDASSAVYAEDLESAAQWDKAKVERERLARLPGSSIEDEAAIAAVMAAAGHFTQARSHLEAALHKKARSDASKSLQVADYALASGDRSGAGEVLRKAVTKPEAAPFELLTTLSQLNGAPILAELRVDGLEVIARYKAQRSDYNTASVLVLDRMVYLVSPNGSATTIVHTITQVRSDEAVESLGEAELPSGARLLRLRTIKPDGRILEPDEVAFKQSLSLPDLGIGDFIELEYVATHHPSDVVPGGFDTGRFYFRDFESAFHQSELVVITPQDMRIIEDPRGDCPQAKTVVRGGLRLSTYGVRGTNPAPEESLAPLSREYLPSIRVLAAATWHDLLGDMRESLSELDRPTRGLSDALASILAGVPQNDHRRRRMAIYDWVLENIDDKGGLFEPAGHILLRRQGSRPRLFAVLCRMAGYEARLGLVRSGLTDVTQNAAPAFDLFDRIAVFIHEDGWINLDHRGAPYGFLPPAMRHRPAVIVDTEEFTSTKAGAVPREERRISMSVALEANGNATVLVREELTGLLATSWREDLRAMTERDRPRQFQDGYLSDTLASATLQKLAIEGENAPGEPLVLTYEAHVVGLATRQGNKLTAKIPMGVTLTEGAAIAAQRTTPLVLAMNTTKRFELRLTAPPGHTAALVRPARDERIQGTFGQVRSFASANGPMLVAGYDAHIDIDRVEPKNYTAFAAFARETDRLTNLEIEISPASDQ
ncbi:MAG: hypothetical protein MUC50_05075 [Myxococcota bacterium]|jgi:tetratricopeptide (TPR) repeat protein|nr:hypothetical protein [Myxococcota bacterium]